MIKVVTKCIAKLTALYYHEKDVSKVTMSYSQLDTFTGVNLSHKFSGFFLFFSRCYECDLKCEESLHSSRSFHLELRAFF